MQELTCHVVRMVEEGEVGGKDARVGNTPGDVASFQLLLFLRGEVQRRQPLLMGQKQFTTSQNRIQKT